MEDNNRSIEYNDIATKYISNTELSKKLYNNITFVEKYIDKVDEIDSDIEKEIIYKELSAMVLSAIEALIKSVLVEINNRCDKKCKEKCNYRQWESKDAICKQNIMDVLKHLNNTRLFWLPPERINNIERLIDLRNYIHLSKYIESKQKEIIIDKNNVNELLEVYYDLLYQVGVNYWYFDQQQICLKNYDEDEYNETNKCNKMNMSQYYETKLYIIVDKLIYNEELSIEEKWIISNLGKIKKRISIDNVVFFTMKLLYFKGIIYKKDDILKIDEDKYNDIIIHKLKYLDLDCKIKSKLKGKDVEIILLYK